ncbi:uncharacterized protein LOC121522849 [Cheilinus undulatus]|uniref:uncharacterized protein LOC121522849 n=1 Tax=Cheilinus undulatus TaxID=241271 RepID=UPI001BD4A7FE|nr:uncharacterized protein LOC121522849 [Cheilinus undulatus]
MARKTTRCFSVLMIYLSYIFSISQGYEFEVIQPQTQMINPDRSASISCEHKANASTVLDVRLNSIQSGEPKMLCQKGKKPCKDMVLYQENDKKFIFFIFNIDQKAMKIKYQCEFTVEHENIHHDGTGNTSTTLLEGQNEAHCKSDQWTVLEFILIGLLAPTFLYSCVITLFCFRQRANSIENSCDPENSTYVEMRKAPPQRNPDFDMMCYGQLNDPTSN